MTPMVSLGKPDLLDQYNLVESKGINIYIRKDIKPKHETLTISLARLLFLKMLTIEGIDEENIYT